MDVALFITCLTDTFFPRIGVAIVRVLRHFGCTVDFPQAQTCCGQPAHNSGFREEARALARRTIDVFRRYPFVVTPSASCAAMMKHHYTELLKDDPAHRAAATDLAARTYDFSVFLRERLRVDAAPLLRWPEATTYHYPCHARHVYSAADLQASLGGGVSAQILAPSRVDLCCGFGGMFAVDFPEVSDAMLSDKLETLAAAGARVVVCNEGGCALHMSGGAHRRGLPLKFKHLAECLAESLGLLEPDP